MTIKQHTEDLIEQAMKALEGLKYAGDEYDDSAQEWITRWVRIPEGEMKEAQKEIISDVLKELQYYVLDTIYSERALERVLLTHGIDLKEYKDEYMAARGEQMSYDNGEDLQ